MTRAATTLADPCTGAQRRDFLLGLRHGQLVRAHVPSWCSGHGVDAGCSQRAGPPGQLTPRRYQTPAEGTGWVSLRMSVPPPGSGLAPSKTAQWGALFPPRWLYDVTALHLPCGLARLAHMSADTE